MTEKEKSRVRFDSVWKVIEQLNTELAQARTELKDLQGANREYRRQLEAVTSSCDYWYRAALKAESERDTARQAEQEQSDEVQARWLSPAEAERLATLGAAEAALAGCGIDGVYDKFDGLADAITQMTEYIGDPEKCMRQEAERRCGKLVQAVRAERQLRQEAEQDRNDWRRVARQERAWVRKEERRAERAEALAALVNEEEAELLERLANSTFPSEYGNAPDVRQCVEDRKTARELAASIREALEVNDES